MTPSQTGTVIGLLSARVGAAWRSSLGIGAPSSGASSMPP
jgi:hypothetical protein